MSCTARMSDQFYQHACFASDMLQLIWCGRQPACSVPNLICRRHIVQVLPMLFLGFPPWLRSACWVQLVGQVMIERRCMLRGLCREAASWILVSDGPERFDAAHLLSHHVQMPLPALDDALSQVAPPPSPIPNSACNLLTAIPVTSNAMHHLAAHSPL